MHQVPPPRRTEPKLPLQAGLIGLAVLVGGFVADIVVSVVLVLFGAPTPIVALGGAASLYGLVLWWCVRASQTWGTGSLRRDVGLSFRPLDLALGLATWFGAVVGEVVVALLLRGIGLPNGSNTDVLTDNRDNTGLLVAVAIIAIVMAPVVEELLFRGVLLRSLQSRLPAWAAIGVQGACFGLVHLQLGLGLGNVVLVAILATVGICFGIAAHLTGRLGPSIVAHTILNSIAVVTILATT